MRIVSEIQHPETKITIFSWNSKYLIKFEQGPLEQTYKVNTADFSSDQDVKAFVSNEFIDKALQQFREMRATLSNALEKL